MTTFVTVIHVIVSVLLVGSVLLQSGKGATQGGMLGGSSQTIFGSSGGANVLTKTTSVLAALFMGTSLTLTVLGSAANKSLFEGTRDAALLPEPLPSESSAPKAE
jgi:preprotein translocase subunit SecG